MMKIESGITQSFTQDAALIPITKVQVLKCDWLFECNLRLNLDSQMFNSQLKYKNLGGMPLISYDELSALLSMSDDEAKDIPMVLSRDTTSNLELIDNLLKLLIEVKSQQKFIDTKALKSIKICIKNLNMNHL